MTTYNFDREIDRKKDKQPENMISPWNADVT